MVANRSTYEVAFSLNSRLASGFARSFTAASSQINNMAKIAKTAAASIAAAFSLKNTIGTGISEAMNLEGFRMQLETATKSSKKAADIMNWSVKLANSTPFETGSVVEASARLEAMGLSAKKYVPMIGDMAGATNKDLIQATEAIIDAQAGELERLKEFGIKKADIVEYAYNKMGKIQVTNNSGQITNQEKFNEAMLALMNEKFKGGMDKQAGTLKGLWSTVTGVTKTALANIVGMTNEGTVKQGSLLAVLKNSIGGVGETLMKLQSSGIFSKLSEVLGSIVGKAIAAIDAIKAPIVSIIPIVINKLQEVKAWGVDAFEKIREKVAENTPFLDKLKGVVENVKAKLIVLKDFGGQAFEAMKPALEWIKNEGLPLVAEGIMFIVEKATDMYNFIDSNWNTIEPIIIGIVSALATYKLALMAVKAQTVIYTNVTKGMAIVQGALNTVMNLSPLAKWSIIIGAAIAAGVYLYKNWDTIKAKAMELWAKIQAVFGGIGSWFQAKWNSVLQITQSVWNSISNFLGSFPLGQALLQNITNMIESAKQIFNGLINFITSVFTGNWQGAWDAVKQIIGGVFSGMVGIVKAPINGIIGLVNQAIEGINSLSLTIPDWVPEWAGGGKTLGFNIPQIPMFAKGTNGFNTPDTFIAGEKGAELVTNARGYKVFNNNKTKNILEKKSFGSSLETISSPSEKVAVQFSPQITVNGSNESLVQEILAELIKYEPTLVKKIIQAVNTKANNNRRLRYDSE